MTASQMETLELTGPLELHLPDGSRVRIRPGPYGKGVAVIPLNGRSDSKVATAPTGQRGRPPRQSTMDLREKLATDAGKGRLRDNQAYVDWMMGRDDTLSLAVARQIVYRERRRLV